MNRDYRGSRKHVLDWVERSDFANQLSQLIKSTRATVKSSDIWMPKGHNYPEEARLEKLGPRIFNNIDWQALQDWWLVYPGGANTPNWDLASTCTIEGQRGLVLIEAKAHTQELKRDGKRLKANASFNSQRNHERIGSAIKEASEVLARIIPGVNISRDTHYQLANRIAFSWKIASLGVPLVLVYLGFLGDESISDIGEPFGDDEHWQKLMRAYTSKCIPKDFIGRQIQCGKASMQMIIRSLSLW